MDQAPYHKLIEHSGDEILDQEDCCDIIRELRPVAHKWYEIGLVLGLTPNCLERLKALAIGESDFTKLLTSMIVEWLKMGYNTVRFGKPTWRRLVKAVRESIGGNNPALADELARKHGVTAQVSQPVRAIIATPPSTEAPQVPTSTCCCCFSSGPSSSESQVNNGEVKYTPEVSIPRRFSGSKRKDSYSKERSDSSASKILESSRATVLAHPTWEIEEITRQEGYCGAMTGTQAEENLRSFGGNCYLLRYSRSQEKYVITVLIPDAEPEITDYQIIITMKDNCRVYEIEGSQTEFPSIAKLLEFYQNTPLTRSRRTIGEVYSKPRGN